MKGAKEIELAKGKGIAIVDEADYEWLNQWKWHLTGGYARGEIGGKGVRHGMCMHRAILMPLPLFQVDHINDNKLDNRRSNLRVCTNTENTQKQAKKSRHNTTSQYKGVGFRDCAWKSMIYVDGRSVRLGRFASEAEAARAYDLAAIQHYGAFAFPNFPTEAAYLAALAQEVANA